MKPATFLSYAEEDAVEALRIHQALTQSGMTVWGYKENGRFGVDFREDFRDQIRSSRYFCLLDSKYARTSEWIKEEWTLAEAVNAEKIICRIEKRFAERDWTAVELFRGQNYIAAIDLTVFKIGIPRLCRQLGIAYTPVFQVPRDQDFGQEVFAAELNDRDRVQELLQLYHEFREQFSDPEFAEAQLRVIIQKCRRYGATNVVSPMLALGVLLAEAGRHREALSIFHGLTGTHPRDPRGWAGAGGAYFELGMYEDSLSALRSSENAIRRFYPLESAARLPEVLHNIGSVLLLLDRRAEAWAVLESLTAEQRQLPYIRAIEGRLLLADGKPATACGYLESAYQKFCEQYSVPAAVVLSLADCYRDIGESAKEAEILKKTMDVPPVNPEICHRAADCFLRSGKPDDAEAALRQASESLPGSPLYRAQLAALLNQRGKVEESTVNARECVRSGLTPQERYYRGLAYYLLGQTASAEFDLQESRKARALASWPHYSQILNRPGTRQIPSRT